MNKKKLFTTIMETEEGNIILKEVENYMEHKTSLDIIWESQHGFIKTIINLDDVEVGNFTEGLEEALLNKKYK